MFCLKLCKRFKVGQALPPVWLALHVPKIVHPANVTNQTISRQTRLSDPGTLSLLILLSAMGPAAKPSRRSSRNLDE